ncbi:MAG: c-type cytochrome biogenesis protein CcmI [Terricaulis sp.]
MLWLALTALAACAAAFVALPYLRRRAAPDASVVEPVDVYASQLASLSRDEVLGDLDPGAAIELRTEVERRILDVPAAAPPPASPPFDRVTAGAVAAIVVLGSAALYAATGSPASQSSRGDGANQSANQSLPDVDTMIERLRARLEEAPGDAEGWRMLGWSYFETNRFEEAVAAYRQATALAPDNAGYASGLAEAITQANNGAVTPEARREFQRAVTSDATDERARYYLALAKAQGGDVRGAVNDWISAIRAAAPDSQWSARMRAEAESAAQQANINIAGRLPPPPPSTGGQAPPITADAVASASQSSPQDQQQMITGMVEGLEQRLSQQPRDAERWVMLMRSRMVLGQPDRATAALNAGIRAFEGDRATQQRLRAAAAELNVPET